MDHPLNKREAQQKWDNMRSSQHQIVLRSFSILIDLLFDEDIIDQFLMDFAATHHILYVFYFIYF